MQSMAGMMDLESRQLQLHEFESMLEVLGCRALFGWDTYANTNFACAVSKRSLTTVDEDLLVSGAGRDVLCWDGRLDNGPELFATFGLTNDSDRQSDPSVMASVLKLRGAGGLGEVVGDWALSFWSPGQQQLLLARDYAGMRPLYWRRCGSRVMWASDMEALLLRSNGPVTINKKFLAGTFAYGSEPADTPFEEIQSVPPGAALCISREGIRYESFWALNPHNKISFRSDAEYEESFRAVFGRAVRDRLRHEACVFAELSGGLDSTSIVSVAKYEMEAGRADCLQVETISNVYDDSSASDEVEFIREAERHVGFQAHHLASSQYKPLILGDELLLKPSFASAFSSFSRAQVDVMRRHNASVLMCGIGGDEIMWNAHEPSGLIADHLRELNLYGAFKTLNDWSRGTSSSLVEIGRSSVRQLLKINRSDQKELLWMSRDARESILQTKRQVGVPSKRSLRNGLSGGFWSCVVNVGQDRHRRWPGVRTTYPFLDRRLVEFCLSIPAEQLLRPGESRSLQRRALRGILPERIRRRRRKQSTGPWLSQSMMSSWDVASTLMDDGLLARLGWLDARRFRTEIDSIRHGVSSQISACVTSIMIELWYRQIRGRVEIKL